MYEPSAQINSYYIAGFRYWGGALVLNKLKPGKKLHLVPEPNNPYDPNAVAIYYKKQKLGFIPRTQNYEVAMLAHFGHDVFEMRVLKVDKKADPANQVYVGLFVKDARKK